MTLKDRFKKYSPDIRFEKIMNEGIVRRTRVDSEQKIVEVDVSFNCIYSKQDVLYPLEKALKQEYKLNNVFINPKYSPELFDDSYINQIMIEARRRKFVSDLLLKNYKFSLSENDLMIETNYGEGGAELMKCCGAEKNIASIIFSEFGLSINVIIIASDKQNEEYKKYLERLTKETFEQSSRQIFKSINNTKKSAGAFDTVTAIEGDSNGCIHAGKLVFDISEATLACGKEFIINPVPIASCTSPESAVVIIGTIYSYDLRETRRGNKTAVFSLSDEEASVTVKCRNRKLPEFFKLTNGISVALKGDLAFDDFDGELTFTPESMKYIKEVPRMDKYDGEKRVELHLHSTMSTMDAILTPTQAVQTAFRWGHRAVAITDHGTAQGFPEAMKASEKLGMKVIYGMEGYLVDDEAKAIYGSSEEDTRLDGEFVVFDIETTGLSPLSCGITEIGAVFVNHGEIESVFSTFVNPGIPIPAEITKLTGINDEMVSDAPSPAEAVKNFLEFSQNKTLVAHNANFDISFIRRACENAGIPFNPVYLDTVSISRFINPELKNHKLDTLAELYGYGDFNHHRACDDAEVTAKIFCKMTEKLAGESIYTVSQMSDSMQEHTDPLKLRTKHIIILVKNPTGLRNLYKLISYSYLKYYKRTPRIPKTVLTENREGLIIGSACVAGELYSAILDGKSNDEIKTIASYYDYLEIQPLSNNEFLISDRGMTRDMLIDINKKIVALGDEIKKPVVATCDAHYLNDWDGICRNILLRGSKMPDFDRDGHLYFRTTDEMMEEFSYLGSEKAREVVITNTNLIADMIGTDIRPFPKGTYTPHMDGAEEELVSICYNTAKGIYGDPLPEIVSARLEKELDSIIKHGFAVLYMIARKLVKYSESQGYLVGSRGSVGSSFVASMAGISEVNPLPPHYICPKCKHSDFTNAENVGSGFDLPQINCPVCGAPYHSDGHDIPFETFLGFFGDKSPDIDLNFSGEVQGKVHKYTEELFGKENVFRAGTVGTLADKTAYGYIAGYFEEKGKNICRAEINRLVSKCVGVKRTTGQHPGGIVVVPKEYEIYDFCPVQHPADDPSSDIITTHFTFNDMHDLLLKLDELGHDVPTKYKYIEKFSNTSVLDVPINDPDVYSLFHSTDALKIKPDDILGVPVGTLGIPENGTDFVIPVLVEAKPQNFADLLQIMGLTHGTDVWAGNAQTLIKNNTCTLSSVVGTRDSIMLSLINYGLDKKDAFDIMELVRKNKKGVPLPDWMVERMTEHNVDEWYIDSLRKIKYMFPKAHAAAYVLSAIRVAWYKVHMPLAFYCAYFSAAPDGFDGELAMQPRHKIVSVLKELKDKGNEQSQKEASEYSAMQLANEYLARGYKFLPVDLYKSDSKLFLPENGAIRLPFSSLGGLGVSAAQNIVKARESGEFLSIEEFKQRSSVSKSVIEILKHSGTLSSLSETNQITFGFDDSSINEPDSGIDKKEKKAKNEVTEKEDEKDSSQSATQLSFF